MNHRLLCLVSSPALVLLGACAPSGQEGSSGSAVSTAPTGAGPTFADPVAAEDGSPQLAEIAWGRLVDVFARDAATGARERLWQDLAIDAQLASDGVDFELARNPRTAAEELTILHAAGTPAFEAALARARELDEVAPKGLGAHVAPPFSAVPRNAAVVLRFDRFVAASAVDATTVRVTTGVEGLSPFAARVFADPNHGTWTDVDGDGASELASTRVVVDFTVSEHEALEHGLSLPITTTGLPAAEHATRANVAVHVSWPGSPASTVRAFRSGLDSDPYGGFLRDDEPPRLLSARAVDGQGPWIDDTGAGDATFRILPTPSAPPFDGASVASRIRLVASEPLRVPATGLEGLTVRRQNALHAFDEQVIGDVVASPDGRELTFVPTHPLQHVAGRSERYVVAIDDALTDLAGNPLGEGELGSFTLDASQPTVTSGGLVLTFDQVDEDGDGKPEISGNHLYNLDPRGSIRPRPVTRFSSVVDSNRPIVAPMTPVNAGIQVPHVPLGAKLHTLWRIYDLGLGLLDRSTWDLDVEGLNWAPFGGAVVADSFAGFEMRLGHGAFLPDENIDLFLLPQFPNTGLVRPFATNYVDPATEKVVHRKDAGYVINPADAFTAVTGTPMIPWPLNQGQAPERSVTYTWRDTGIDAVGAPNGAGVDILRYAQVTGIVNNLGAFAQGQVPTIGLPLLMEFRCHPDAGAIGVNGTQMALAVNSSARPYFRAFSAGGFDTQGQAQPVDPDNEPMATGGFNPLGNPTAPNDNAVQFGQVDFVVRVSRTLSAWFDTGSATGATFSPATLAAALPEGTSVTIEFRGATDVSTAVGNANAIGAYGNTDATAVEPFHSQVVTFLNGDDDWKPQASDIDGARFFQFRLTFTSNIASLATPTLGVVAVPFTR